LAGPSVQPSRNRVPFFRQHGPLPAIFLGSRLFLGHSCYRNGPQTGLWTCVCACSLPICFLPLDQEQTASGAGTPQEQRGDEPIGRRRMRAVEESTFPETYLPTPVPREAISSSAADWRPSSRPLRRRRVAGALRSFAEDEGDGVEKFPKDLLACSSAGKAMSSTPGRPRATAACQWPSSPALRRRRLLEAGAFLLPLVFCAS